MLSDEQSRKFYDNNGASYEEQEAARRIYENLDDDNKETMSVNDIINNLEKIRSYKESEDEFFAFKKPNLSVSTKGFLKTTVEEALRGGKFSVEIESFETCQCQRDQVTL